MPVPISRSRTVIDNSDCHRAVGTCTFYRVDHADLLTADQIEKLDDMLLCDTLLPAFDQALYGGRKGRRGGGGGGGGRREETERDVASVACASNTLYLKPSTRCIGPGSIQSWDSDARHPPRRSAWLTLRGRMRRFLTMRWGDVRAGITGLGVVMQPKPMSMHHGPT